MQKKINDQVIIGGEEEYFQTELLRTVSNSIGIQGNILNAKGKNNRFYYRFAATL